MQTKNKISLILVFLSTVLFLTGVNGGEVTLLNGERIVFTTLIGNLDYVSYPCGNIARRAVGGNYDVDNEPYFDGPIAPISYPVSSGLNKLHFNASLSYKNYRILSDLHGSGDGAYFDNGVLDCNPVYTGSLSADSGAFAWGEWLYGTFRDVSSGKVYSPIYNEYYGGHYPGQDNYSTYVATGLAVSLNNGATFSKIQDAPNHVILRLPSLRQNITTGQGLSWFGGIFKSPLDQMYYMGANDYASGQTAMVRTNNLDAPTSWRAWNGSDWTVSMVPLTQPFQPIGVNPLYLGYSDYFKKYIAVTTGNVGGDPSRGNYQIVYNLSEDLVHWGSARKIMDNPTCPPTGDCGSIASYPSIMDPVYLSDSGNSTKASNGMIGAHPYVTYIKNVNSGQTRQQFAVQQVNFDDVVFNRMDNFSVRAVVGNGNLAAVMGFIMQGTEEKKMVFRALGPSLPDLGYPKLRSPRISLYNGSGALLATNRGWRSGPDAAYLASIGFNPSSDEESALVATLGPGTYTLKIDTLCLECENGIGLLEAYDFSSTAESKIVNVSIRGYGQPGNGALTMGFISRGGQTALVRGTGVSTLVPAGFSPVIPNPYITAYDNVGNQIASNDDWNTPASNGSAIQGYGFAPGDSLESATIFSTQTPIFSPTSPNSVYANYLVQLQGTGYGLLELYNVNAN